MTFVPFSQVQHGLLDEIGMAVSSRNLSTRMVNGSMDRGTQVCDGNYVQTVYCNGNRAERIRIVPLTVKVVDRLTEPARFDAEQAYSPAWRAETPSMLRVLKCLLILVIVIPVSFDVSIGVPLNDHDMSIGMSPFRIEQGTDTESPQLAISALKAIGRSCGPTRGIVKQTIMLYYQKR